MFRDLERGSEQRRATTTRVIASSTTMDRNYRVDFAPDGLGNMTLLLSVIPYAADPLGYSFRVVIERADMLSNIDALQEWALWERSHRAD